MCPEVIGDIHKPLGSTVSEFVFIFGQFQIVLSTTETVTRLYNFSEAGSLDLTW